MGRRFATKTEAEHKFWMQWKTEKLFQEVIKGVESRTILTNLKMKENTYMRLLSNDFFQRRLKVWIDSREISDYVMARIKLRNEFENRLEAASDDLIVRAFLALSLGTSDKKNAIIKILKDWKEDNPLLKEQEETPEAKEEEVQKALDETFGRKTPIINDVKQKYPALVEGTRTSNEQEETN